MSYPMIDRDEVADELERLAARVRSGENVFGVRVEPTWERTSEYPNVILQHIHVSVTLVEDLPSRKSEAK